MDYAKESLRLHGEWKGKIEVTARVPVETKDDLSLAYTPGVAQPCLEIQKDLEKSYELTRRWNLCAVITDGSAIKGFREREKIYTTCKVGITVNAVFLVAMVALFVRGLM